jgi:hypothetical protein
MIEKSASETASRDTKRNFKKMEPVNFRFFKKLFLALRGSRLRNESVLASTLKKMSFLFWKDIVLLDQIRLAEFSLDLKSSKQKF